MIDKIQMAKDLITKAEELGDDELLAMAHSLLNEQKTTLGTAKQQKRITKPKVLIDFTNNSEPDGEIKLKPPIENTLGPRPNYVCINCKHECFFEKTRKRCPRCKKHKLIFIEYTEQADGNKSDANVTTVFKDKPQQVVTNEDGKVLEKRAKNESINLANINYNRFSDDGSIGQDEENDYLKTKPISTRGRKPFKTVSVKCDKCGKSEQVAPIYAAGDIYRCTRCLVKGSRR
jgi:hypothetical protein